MKVVVNILAKLSLMLYPIKLELKVVSLLDKVYSKRIKTLFAYCGESFLCHRYITLWHPQFIRIGNNAHVFNSCIMAVHKNSLSSTYGKITIGDNATIGESTHITCANEIVIGHNFLSGRRCTITDNSHGHVNIKEESIAPIKREIVSKGRIHIGNNVWLGDNVIVLPGVEIGDGCIIGASSVVTKTCPPHSVCVGNPARVIKTIY